MSTAPPGLLPNQVNPDVVMMICTAGHVDHGKTLLVKCLTGCSTDRLKEEQERGMTIELGFAPCFLQNNLCVGIVDVPGHEKFIKTMVAGVSGIGLTMLIIAADDGIMPQTVEHLQIMELLGVRHGIVVLTKIDLASPERLAQCQGDIRTFVRGTFLENAPICPVSSKTFDGYGDLYEVLTAKIRSVTAQPKPGIFRMPIEEVFALSGQGTVITGIPLAGSIQVGAQVEVVPGGQTGRIRGIQRFMREASQGGYGQCLALNIPELNKFPPERGHVLCPPGYLQPAHCLHVTLRLVPGLKKPLKNAEEIKFHAGTAEANGKLFLLEGDEIEAGNRVLATVMLNTPVAVAVRDRFILRRPSPPASIAGGEVLSITQEANRPRRAHTLALLKAYETFFGNLDPASEAGLDRQVEWWLLWEQKTGASWQNITCGLLYHPDIVKASLARLISQKKVLSLAEDFQVHTDAYGALRKELEERIKKAGQDANALSLTLADLRKDLNWPAPLWNKIEAELVQANQIQRRGDKVLISAAIEKLSPEDRQLIDQVLKVYEDTGFHSPRPEELPEQLKVPLPRLQRLLDLLYNERKLIRLSPLVVLSYSHYKKAQDMVVKIIQDKGVLNSADFKGNLDTTRKYALAILDFMDARRITVRKDNDRRLMSDYQRNLL